MVKGKDHFSFEEVYYKKAQKVKFKKNTISK